MGSNLRSSLTCRRLVACDGTGYGADLRLGAGQVYTGMVLLVLYLGLLHPRPILRCMTAFAMGMPYLLVELQQEHIVLRASIKDLKQ